MNDWHRLITAGAALCLLSPFSVLAQINDVPVTELSVPAAYDDEAPATAQVGPSDSDLFYQLQTLQEEVMQLRDLVEQQAREIRLMKQESMERYIDLDRRLVGMGPNPVLQSQDPNAAVDGAEPSEAATPGASNAGVNTGLDSAPANPVEPVVAAPAVSDREAYQAAYSLAREKRYDDAALAFQAFLEAHSGSQYTANARYWLGAIFMLKKDFEAAEPQFSAILSETPGHSKVPDAMFKLAQLHFSRDNRLEAKRLLDKIVADYSGSNSSAARLAADFLAKHY